MRPNTPKYVDGQGSIFRRLSSAAQRPLKSDSNESTWVPHKGRQASPATLAPIVNSQSMFTKSICLRVAHACTALIVIRSLRSGHVSYHADFAAALVANT